MKLSTVVAGVLVGVLASTPLSAVAEDGDGRDRAGRDPLRGAVNLPPDGKVDFVLGQDGGTLQTFAQTVLEDDPTFPRPGGVSLFTSINGLTPLNGLWSPVDYGVGRTHVEEVLNRYPGDLTIGLELIDYSQDLGTEGRNLGLRAIAGDPSVEASTVTRYRGWVDELIRYADATGRDVFLKIGYEFDGHWNNYEPAAYRAAFRHIARRIDDLGATRVATVWQTAAWGGAIPDKPVVGVEAYRAADAVAAGTARAHWDRWYPGDDAVDWMGLSQFATETALDPGRPWSCDRGPAGAPDTTVAAPRDVQDALLDFARAHDKPVMVAEAAPQGYDLGEHTVACIFAGGDPAPWEQRTPVGAEEIWREWFAPTFDYVRENRDVIRSITYINTDWDNQANWACTGPGACDAYWGDSRLQADPTILQRVRDELADDRLWTSGEDRAEEFVAPDFSRRNGYEAEYAEASTWLDCCGLGGLPQTTAGASNGREVMVMNYGDGGAGSYGVTFADLRPGRRIAVTLTAPDDGSVAADATFSVLVDGRRVGGPLLVPRLPAGEYATLTVDARTRQGSDVTVQLDPNSGGGMLRLDRIVIGRTS